MKILALDTSSLTGSVAVLEDDRLIDQLHFSDQQRTAQSFAPALREILKTVGWQPRDLELIAVTQGPGSFTGLRIGVTAAKTLAYATGAEVIGVNTLRVIADQAASETSADRVSAVINAQRGELFAADFTRGPDGEITDIGETRIVSNEQWIDSLQPGTLVTGHGLKRLLDRLPESVIVADAERWQPQASTVGRIALRLFANGTSHDYWTLTPQYFRKSAAEEKWDQPANDGQ